MSKLRKLIGHPLSGSDGEDEMKTVQTVREKSRAEQLQSTITELINDGLSDAAIVRELSSYSKASFIQVIRLYAEEWIHEDDVAQLRTRLEDKGVGVHDPAGETRLRAMAPGLIGFYLMREWENLNATEAQRADAQVPDVVEALTNEFCEQHEAISESKVVRFIRGHEDPLGAAASEGGDISFRSVVTGENEFVFTMEGMEAKIRRLPEKSPRMFSIDIRERPEHVAVEINVDSSIVITGDTHGLVVGNAPSEHREDSMVAHVYNIHPWGHITDDNQAVGMAYDGTTMDGGKPRKLKLTGEETW